MGVEERFSRSEIVFATALGVLVAVGVVSWGSESPFAVEVVVAATVSMLSGSRSRSVVDWTMGEESLLGTSNPRL